jgi:hypothetical protein
VTAGGADTPGLGAQEERPDPVLDALDELLRAARANIAMWIEVMDRVDVIRVRRGAGTAYRDIATGAPSLLDLVAGNQERLTAAAAVFRRAVARQLHDEGMSPAEIARAFGVTRQRVGNLHKSGE